MIVAGIPGFPVSASDHAMQVDILFAGLLAISVGICLLLFALIGFCMIRYRAGSTADRSPSRVSPIWMEITWTGLTAFAFTGIFAWATVVYFKQNPVAASSIPIHVIGRQWMWEIGYRDGRREHNRLHVPVGRLVKLTMISEDVIHSFYIPALRIKQDVVPGKYVTLSFIANRTGDFPIYCAEYCGTKHSEMIGVLSVMEPTSHAKWVEQGPSVSPLVEQGRKLFADRGCAGCHFQGASVHAPLLDGLHGRQVPLQGGSFVEADDQYLHDSILLPLKQIVAGYEPVMPSYQGQLDEIQVIALVEYLKSLPPAGPADRIRPDPERLEPRKSE